MSSTFRVALLCLVAAAASAELLYASVQFYKNMNCTDPMFDVMTVSNTCQDVDAIADAVFGFNISAYIDASLRYDWTPEDGGYGGLYVGVTNCTGNPVVKFSMDDRHVGQCNPINGTLDFQFFNWPYAFAIDVIGLHDSSAVSTMVSAVVACGAFVMAAMLAL